MRSCLAEFIGTFALVFIGVGSIYVNAALDGRLGLTGIALVTGLAIMAMVYAFRGISGSHFNPAVTCAMWLTRRISARKALAYVTAQLAAAVLGSVFLLQIFGRSQVGVCSLTNVHALPAIGIEAALSFFLVAVIWASAIDPRSPKLWTGIAIGAAVSTGILLGGKLTGAAMNPARALGPAFATGCWSHQLVYWVGPLLGGSAAGLLYDRYMRSLNG